MLAITMSGMTGKGIRTDNLGISIHSVITVRGFTGEIYAALTGDQCTITDIHITA